MGGKCSLSLGVQGIDHKSPGGHAVAANATLPSSPVARSSSRLTTTACWPPSKTSAMALDALEMAIWARPSQSLAGLVHHSDRGVQYLSIRYLSLLILCLATRPLLTSCRCRRQAMWKLTCDHDGQLTARRPGVLQ